MNRKYQMPKARTQGIPAKERMLNSIPITTT
jgi:hypothetical protein